MKHPSDQDLLLLSHQSLGTFKSVMAVWHMRRCASCRKRFSQYGSFSSAIASTMRVGLPAWKPFGMALRLKLLLATLVISSIVLGGEVIIAKRNSEPLIPQSGSAAGEVCDIKAAPPIDVKGGPRGINKPARGVRPKVN